MENIGRVVWWVESLPWGRFRKRKPVELKEVVDEAAVLREKISASDANVKALMNRSLALDKKVAEQVDALQQKMVHQQKAFAKQMLREQDSFRNLMEQSLSDLKIAVGNQSEGVELVTKSLLDQIHQACGVLAGVNEGMGGMRDYLVKNNAQLQRLQEGYDFQILKNFVRQITRIISRLDSQLLTVADELTKEELLVVKEDLVALLDRNGIQLIEPAVGTVYTHHVRKYAEVSRETVEAPTPDLVGRIERVEQVGYKYGFNDGQERIIQPAKITLYQ